MTSTETSAHPSERPEAGHTGADQGQQEGDPAQAEPTASTDAVERQHGQPAACDGAAEEL